MAKFCTRCGKPLEDGKPCSCVNDVVENSNSTCLHMPPHMILF